MKKIAILLILISGIVLFDACKKAETDPKLDMSTAVKPVVSEPAEGSEIQLTKETANDTVTFSWNAAQYSLDDLASTSYLLQIVQADSSFDGAKELISTIETSFSTTQAELNNTLISMGLTPLVPTNMKFRVSSSLKSYDDGKTIPHTVLDSDVINTMMTAYESSGPPEYAKLWVPGDYQGWAPDVAPNIFSVEDDGMYSGYVYYPAESASFLFKFTDQPNWDGTNYGTGASAGTLDPAGDNLEVPGAGNYFITADINNLLWSHELRNFTLVGSMTDWGNEPDIELTWDADNMVWTVTMDFAADDAFKWRANLAWDFDYGINNPDDGKLTPGGNDVIVTTSGNYTVNLYLNEAFPRYELIAN